MGNNISPHPIALITGASSGLGSIFARQLAAQGFGLILVARRKERLEALAADIRARHAVPIEVFPADLSADPDLERLEQRIGAIESLELLVNNAGFNAPGRFARVPPERYRQMISVHITATVRLTHAALPGMLRRHQGGIINVASLAAFFPLIGSSVYSATKSALVAFTRVLALELDGSGVQVQVLCPGFFYSEFHETSDYKGIGRSNLLKLISGAAEPIVTQSLKALRRGQVICIPGWYNKLFSIFGRNHLFLPIVNTVLKRVLRRR